MKYKPTKLMAKDSAYDKEKADRAVAFIQSLKHTKGQWAGKPFNLLPWQEQIIRDLFGVVKPSGYRQFNTAYVEIPKKQGKQLALETPIPTPLGWSTMGELKVGDLVFDENGKPCHVVAKSEIDDTEQAYKMTFRDGSGIVAGARHLWNVEKIIGKNVKKLLSTEELFLMTEHQKQNKDEVDSKRSVIRIPVCGKLNTEEAELPIDPYLYGYWLGNGNSTKCEITVRTEDVPHVRERIPYKVYNQYPQKCGGSWILNYKELKPILVKSFRDKVIRPEYLRSSIEQRLCLLCGLMDSDGCVGKIKGQATYVSTIRQLADSVRELLWSLGIKNAMTECPSTRCGKPTGETLYTIRFTAFDDKDCSCLIRKAERRREKKARQGLISITSSLSSHSKRR